MDNICIYYKRDGNRCDKKITKKDPEGKFCAIHRRSDSSLNIVKPTIVTEKEKLLDYETFRVSCIDF